MIVSNGERIYIVTTTTTTKDSLTRCLDIETNVELWLPTKLVTQLPEVEYTRNGYGTDSQS